MGWYAVHTNSRSEWLAAKRLKEQGYEVLYLHYQDVVKHARRKIAVLKPYFPRYLFTHVDPCQSIYTINKTEGVSTVVYAADEPLQIPFSVIEELRERADKNGLVTLQPQEKEERRRFNKGEKVRIEEGPFIGFVAAVSLDTGSKVRVFLDMFKGRVESEFFPAQVSPVRRRMEKAAS